MVNADSFLDIDELNRLVDGGYISRRDHPRFDLHIYNYTPRAQFDRVWTPETLQCRGLILDHQYRVYARPFQKFFNLGEKDADLPIGDPFEVFEKLDGSLGIAYTVAGETYIATRGAFASEQALWATDWWANALNPVTIPDGETWLFEIIYPGNRIVVNYGDRAELVLLAVIDNETGKDLPMPTQSEWPYARARRFDLTTVEEIAGYKCDDPSNFEGFVLRYLTTGQRVKVKLDEYVRLHRLLTQCSSKTVWELLASGQGLDAVLDRVPDEFYGWVREQEKNLTRQFDKIVEESTTFLNSLLIGPGRLREATRKDLAQEIVKFKYPSVVFKLLDGKDPAPLVWKMVKPEYEKPFVTQHETAS